MKRRNNKFTVALLALGAVALMAGGCQKKLGEDPDFADYPQDTNPPGGPLKFYVAFDGTTSNALMNGVDSIRANFASSNTFETIDGVSGKAAGSTATGHEAKYTSSNDWASSSSFTVAFWGKHNGVPVGEAEFAFTIPSTVGHWSNSTLFLLFDHTGAGATNDLAVIKFMINDNNGEKWFELVGADRMPGIYDNQWHHFAFTYDESNSTMSIYKDGTLFRSIVWTGHGKLALNTEKITGIQVGGKTTDWGRTWIGGLDQFRLYGTVLTAAEVNELYVKKL